MSFSELQEKQMKVEAELSRLRQLPSTSSYRVHREKVALKCQELIEICLSVYQNDYNTLSATTHNDANERVNTGNKQGNVNVLEMEDELANLLGSLSI